MKLVLAYSAIGLLVKIEEERKGQQQQQAPGAFPKPLLQCLFLQPIRWTEPFILLSLGFGLSWLAGKVRAILVG